MALPLILGGLAVLGGGLFVGSQIDDAVEKTTQTDPTVETSVFTFSNMAKLALLTGTAYVALQAAEKAGLLK